MAWPFRAAGAQPMPADASADMRVARTVIAGDLAPLGADRLTGNIAPRVADEAEVWQALVVGLRDYVRKNGFRSVIIALSGGIDSSVVAAIAVDAVWPSQVYGVALPGRQSPPHSRDDPADPAARTGPHQPTA